MTAVSLDVHNHLGDSGRDEAHVSQGQVAEEEVHGGVEVGVRGDSQDDEQVPQHGNPGTWTGTAQGGGAAVLAHLRVPGGRIPRHLLDFAVP